MTSSELDPRGQRRQPKLRRSVLAALFAVMLLAPMIWTHEYQELEHAALDLQARSRPAIGSPEVVVVEIEDADYDSLFGSRSPLEPTVLGQVIRGIALGHPGVIGVDIETSDESFAILRTLADSIQSSGGPPIVWAQDAVSECAEQHETEDHECQDSVINPFGVLGGDVAPGVRTGLVLALQDPGGTIRRFRATFSSGSNRLPSFAWAVWRAWNPTEAVTFDTTRTRYVRFHRPDPGSRRLRAATVLELARTPGFSDGGLLDGKIVLLGGSYRAGRDQHHTPVGILAGVSIQAQTVETIVAGGGSVVPSLFNVASLQLVVGSVLVIALSQLGLGSALLLSLGVASLLTFIGSLVLTGSLIGGLPYFAPLALAIVLALVHEHLSFYRAEFTLRAYEYATGRPGRHTIDESLAKADDTVDRAQSRVSAFAATARKQSAMLVDTIGARIRSLRGKRAPVTTAPEPEPAIGDRTETGSAE